MTFIASVKAKDGVAIIADSLMTTSTRVAVYNDFMNYLKRQSDESGDGIKLDPKEISKLFKTRTLHTKDYEDKLYQYGKYTAITTTGSASINGKRIKRLVADATKKYKPNGNTSINAVNKRLAELKEFITEEVKKYLQHHAYSSATVLIVTSFLRSKGAAVIHKLHVNKATKADLKNPDFIYVDIEEQSEDHTVICDGQNRLSEKLLFGDFSSIYEVIPKVIQKMAKDFGIPNEKITNEYVMEFYKDRNIITQQTFEDMKIFKLTELSLQQAVDLASLLMRIEIDIQKYTENIPTVGGVIKLATINDKGFNWISGHEIVKHENFFY